MKLTIHNAVAALEQFEEEFVEAAVTPTVQEEETSDAMGQDIEKESVAIDQDGEELAGRAEKLDGVIEMVEETDTPPDEPLPAVAQKGVDIALESIGLGLEAEDAKATKEGLLAKLMRWIQSLWAAMQRFGARISGFVRKVYTYAIDRSARNRFRAERAKKRMGEKTFNRKMTQKQGRSTQKFTSADVYSPRLLKALARPGNVSLSKAIDNIIEYVKTQGRAVERGLVLDACVVFGKISENPKEVDGQAKDYLTILQKIGEAGSVNGADDKQRKRIDRNTEGTKVMLSGVFFGGYRSYVAIPTSINHINNYIHGMAKVDDTGGEVSLKREIPEVSELISIADQVLKLDECITEYRAQGKELDSVVSKLESMGKRVADVSKKYKSDSEVNTAHIRKIAGDINTTIPRVLKGPQVDVVKYASEVGSMIMTFVESSMTAYEEAAGFDPKKLNDVVKAGASGLPNMTGMHGPRGQFNSGTSYKPL